MSVNLATLPGEASMLARLLQDKMKEKDLSAREVSRQTGVAHTTIIRIMNGKNVDLETIKAVGNWLNIEISNLLNSEPSGKDMISSTIAAFLDKNPKLRLSLTDAIFRLQKDEIQSNDLEDILIYIAFRLQMTSQKKSDISKNNTG